MTTLDFIASLLAAFRSETEGAVERAVERALKEALPSIVREASLPPYVDTATLAEYTGLSVRQIQYLRAKGRIPFVQRGRLVRYPTADVLAYLEEGRVPVRSQRS